MGPTSWKKYDYSRLTGEGGEKRVFGKMYSWAQIMWVNLSQKTGPLFLVALAAEEDLPVHVCKTQKNSVILDTRLQLAGKPRGLPEGERVLPRDIAGTYLLPSPTRNSPNIRRQCWPWAIRIDHKLVPTWYTLSETSQQQWNISEIKESSSKRQSPSI